MVGVLAALVVYVAPTLGGPLLENHAFRQTQTAFTAREFHERGLDLLHPKLPVFGEPFEAPFEFPLFQALAVIPMELGVEEDAALRLTSLACFLATALFLYGLVRYVAGRVSGVAALVAFTLTPLALVWSRASMIEYLATAGAVGFTWSLIAWRERRRPLLGALALAAGLVGMLVKPTTAVFWILPALLYRPTSTKAPARRLHLDAFTIVAAAVPVLAAALWTRHADGIKAASPTTEWLTSWNLRYWNFGGLGQRFEPGSWLIVLERVGLTVVGFLGIFLLPAAIATIRSRQWPFWLGVASAALLPPLVFTNLYFVHDYYLAGVSPALAALIGLGAGWVASRLRGRLVVALAAVGLILVYASLELGRGYWLRIHGGYDDPQVLPLAREIRAQTQPSDLVAIDGLDWSPAVLYYAHRRGHMVTERSRRFAWDLIHRDGYHHVVQVDPAHDDLAFLSRWRWLGALGPHLYAIADTPTELPNSRFVATYPDEALLARLAAGGEVGGWPRSLPCGRPTRLPSGKRGTWIRFATADANTRVFAAAALAPVPARPAVYVAPALADRGHVTLNCTGAGAASLTVLEVTDAPGPIG